MSMLRGYACVLTPELDQGVECMAPDDHHTGPPLFLMNLMIPIMTGVGEHHDINSLNITAVNFGLFVCRFLMMLNQPRCLFSFI